MTAGKMILPSVVLTGLYYTSICMGYPSVSFVCETIPFMHRWATANLISQSQRKCDLRHDQVQLCYHMLKPFSRHPSDNESYECIYLKTKSFSMSS